MKAPLRGIRLFLMTLSVSLGIFVNLLDMSITNLALPAIAGDLGITPHEGIWIITSFSVSLGVTLPLTGFLGKRFGEIRLFVFGMLIFILASLLCGLATNIYWLLLCRVLQGAVAGPLIPVSQSILLSRYPEEKKGLATALWGMVAVVSPIFGPITGGWITEQTTWPWIFYINIPFGIFSAYITWFLLCSYEKPMQKIPLDLTGLILLIIGVGSLQIMCDQGRMLDWFSSDVIISLSIICIITLSCFFIWEWRHHSPVVDLFLFKKWNFSIGTILLSIGYLLFFSNIAIFPFWLQTQMGYTAIYAGVASASIAVLSFFFLPIVGVLIQKVDLRYLASISFSIFCIASFWSAHFYTQLDFFQFILPRLFQGIGTAFFYPPLISVILSGLPEYRIASALGLANFFRMISVSVGISLCMTLVEHREKLHYAQLSEAINTLNPVYFQMMEKLHSLGMQDKLAFNQVDLMMIKQSYMLAMNDFFLLSGWVFLCLLGLIWLINPIVTNNERKLTSISAD